MKNLELRIMRRDFEFSILNSQFLIFVAVCALCVCSRAEDLRFRFQPGDKFSLVSVTQTRRTRSLSPDTNQDSLVADTDSAKQTFRTRGDLDIEEVEPDGSAWAKYTYRQVALKIEGEGTEIDFDSDESRSQSSSTESSFSRPGRRAEAPIQALPWISVINEGFYLRITPQGRITNINGLNAVIGNAKSKIPNVPIKGQFNSAIEQQFSEQSVKRSLTNQLAVFPDANASPVSTGDTWSRIQIEDEEAITTKRTYQLKEYRDGAALVDVNIIVASVPDAGPVFIREMRAEREISGRGAGQIEIEQSSGRIINSTTTQDLVEKIRFLPQGPIRRPPPAPAPARTHIVTTFQMIKREPDKLPVASEANQP